MSIKFKLVERKDLTKGAAAGDKRFYPQLVMNGQVSEDELCDEIAEQSSLTSGDVKNVLDRLVNRIAAHMRNGRGVDAGDLGKFRPVLRSEGAKTSEGYDAAAMMRPVKVVYTPGKRIRQLRGDVQYERVAAPKPADGDTGGGSEDL